MLHAAASVGMNCKSLLRHTSRKRKNDKHSFDMRLRTYFLVKGASHEHPRRGPSDIAASKGVNQKDARTASASRARQRRAPNIREPGPARARAAMELARRAARAHHPSRVQRNCSGMTMCSCDLVLMGWPFCSKIMATYSVDCRSTLNVLSTLRNAASSRASKADLANKLPQAPASMPRSRSNDLKPQVAALGEENRPPPLPGKRPPAGGRGGRPRRPSAIISEVFIQSPEAVEAVQKEKGARQLREHRPDYSVT